MANIDEIETKPPRFVVGMDLGTTNSAVCYVDTAESPWQIRTLSIPQLVAPGVVESREILPLFHYEPAPGEFDPALLRLPFGPAQPQYIVGVLARDHGANVPGRLISSAKSWLCHSGVDRTAPLLPWHGAPDVTRLSPVEVSARYLGHIVQVWNHQFPNYPLAEQDFVLTIPASFDEIARQLTVKAAALAGLNRITLIEEPQAAFYSWIYRHAQSWPQVIKPGQKILVCDIGGGTTDLTLIRVRRAEDGTFRFHRVAVGEHLILGGDNLDLALAHHIESKLGEDEKLDPQTWSVLVRKCQRLKEELLGPQAPERLSVSIPGRGTRLIGGARRVELERAEVVRLLVDGFFPIVELNDKPNVRRIGFQEFGLPYAPDPAVTRYLAAFLTAHRYVALDETNPAYDPARPDLILFNGGLFFSEVIRQRVLDVVTYWFAKEDKSWQPIAIENPRLDLAVAEGAAYYGMVRRGEGVRISAGLARSYYLGVDVPHPNVVAASVARQGKARFSWTTEEEANVSGASPSAAQIEEASTRECLGFGMCVIPSGVEPGQEVSLKEKTFRLRVGEPVEFPVYYSGTRLTDQPGDLIPVYREELTPLPPIRTVLKTGKRSSASELDVTIHAQLSEIGTLELWCAQVEGRGTWRLEFDVRSAVQTDLRPHEGLGESEGVLDEETASRCLALIDHVFSAEGRDPPENLLKRMSQVTEMNRKDWPPTFLRRIWQRLIENEVGRRRSAAHEARWLNLTGFALRPGFGLAADDWRVSETWRILHGKLFHPTPACRAEWWVLWRRIAGGLTAGHQQALANPLLASFRSFHKQQTTGTGNSDFPYSSHEATEILRLLGSLELIAPHWKVELGDMVLDLLPKKKLEHLHEAMLWLLARLGARVPMYGPLNCLVPADVAVRWLDHLVKIDPPSPLMPFVVMQLARLTQDRYRDLPQKARDRALKYLAEHNASDHLLRLVREGGHLETDEQTQLFGESLPKGLRVA
ncbi:MAG TPA: Hsp70 family protein [Thermogutta sp.]|nr:Hsp70 family protein [Thermogutta sp.]